MNRKLNKAEKAIEDQIDEFVSISEPERKAIESVIDHANQKRSVTLRLKNSDLERLKDEARKEGIPYQTLINSIVHKYVTNRLVDAKHVKRIAAMLR
jgi:predicted DNA binding CopG/RHH family protein